MNGCINNSVKNLLVSPKFSFLLAALWMIFLYIMSSLPKLARYDTFYGQDKIEHVIAFGVLGFLLFRGFYPSICKKGSLVVLLVTLIIAAYGALDEFHQMFVPGRTASLADLAADITGGLLASSIAYLLVHHCPGRRIR